MYSRYIRLLYKLSVSLHRTNLMPKTSERERERMMRSVWQRGSVGCEMSVTLKRECQLEARPSLSAHQFIPGLFSIWAGMSGWYGEWPPLASLCAGAMEDMWGGVRTNCWREERTEIESRVGGDTQRSYWKSWRGDISDPLASGSWSLRGSLKAFTFGF